MEAEETVRERTELLEIFFFLESTSSQAQLFKMALECLSGEAVLAIKNRALENFDLDLNEVLEY